MTPLPQQTVVWSGGDQCAWNEGLVETQPHGIFQELSKMPELRGTGGYSVKTLPRKDPDLARLSNCQVADPQLDGV